MFINYSFLPTSHASKFRHQAKLYPCHTENKESKGVVQSQVKYGVRSPKFVWTPCAQLYSLADTPPSPAVRLTYEGDIGQPRMTSLCNHLSTEIANRLVPNSKM